MQLVILILAAGKSSRMGSIKQLLKVNGKTLLNSAIETSKKLTNVGITCVLGANAKEIKKETDSDKIDFVINKNYESGLSSSIITGIKHLQEQNTSFDGVLILLADQPAISVAYYKEMVAIFTNEKNKIIASNYGHKFGVPVIFPKSFIKNLLEIKGDKGAKEFLQQNKNDILSPKLLVNLLDIDTPKDYKLYINSL
jgi:molybdenum cofactor cytidylyltransferase